MEKEVERSGVLGCMGISPHCFACSRVVLFSDTLAHIGYPVAVGVVGWLVDDGKQPVGCQ